MKYNVLSERGGDTFLEEFFKVTQLPSGWAFSIDISPLQVLCTRILLDDSLNAENLWKCDNSIFNFIK